MANRPFYKIARKPRRLYRLTAFFILPAFVCAGQSPNRPSSDWPAYGGGGDEIRYSTLDQINRENAHRLQVAWTFETGDSFNGSEFQCNPLVVDGVLYATTPKSNVIALDAVSGASSLVRESTLLARCVTAG